MIHTYANGDIGHEYIGMYAWKSDIHTAEQFFQELENEFGEQVFRIEDVRTGYVKEINGRNRIFFTKKIKSEEVWMTGVPLLDSDQMRLLFFSIIGLRKYVKLRRSAFIQNPNDTFGCEVIKFMVEEFDLILENLDRKIKQYRMKEIVGEEV